VGDWAADLVIGKAHKGAIVTRAKRRTRLFLALPIARKTAELTTAAITCLLTQLNSVVHTITYDNGREFSHHQKISDALPGKGYFARPYHS
jgi:IS30 family transposase